MRLTCWCLQSIHLFCNHVIVYVIAWVVWPRDYQNPSNNVLIQHVSCTATHECRCAVRKQIRPQRQLYRHDLQAHAGADLKTFTMSVDRIPVHLPVGRRGLLLHLHAILRAKAWLTVIARKNPDSCACQLICSQVYDGRVPKMTISWRRTAVLELAYR